MVSYDLVNTHISLNFRSATFLLYPLQGSTSQSFQLCTWGRGGLMSPNRPHPVHFLKDLFIFRETGREGEREGEKYQSVASHTPQLQPRHVL